MSISTKKITSTPAFVSKTIEPGNTTAKILNVYLEEFTFSPGAYNMILSIVGQDRGADFDGFFIDPNDHSKGKHKGQVGRVKAGEYAFADGTTKSGIVIKRDDEILKFINFICKEIDSSWLEEQDGKHETIESLVKAFDNEKPFNNIWMNFCIAGKEYLNKEGYTKYDLFLPRYSKGKVAFEVCDKANSKLMKFNEEEHIKKSKAKEVKSFGEQAETSSDFEL